jgi:transcriptional regulator with GAF, ATPase, and Fis domain
MSKKQPKPSDFELAKRYGLRAVTDAVEKGIVKTALRHAAGKIAPAARLVHTKPGTFKKAMRRHSVDAFWFLRTDWEGWES